MGTLAYSQVSDQPGQYSEALSQGTGRRGGKGCAEVGLGEETRLSHQGEIPIAHNWLLEERDQVDPVRTSLLALRALAMAHIVCLNDRLGAA